MRKDPLAILFDLDGTLCIREATRRRYADLFLAAFGGVLESDDPELVAAALAKADGDGYNASRFSDLAADPLWAERPCVEDLARHWDHHFPTCAVCIPEVPLALERLQSRGLHLGVVTNGVETKQRRKLEAMGIADIFGTVVISGRFGVPKPDPRIFQAAAADLGVRPTDCWFVGDHPHKDVAGAASVGMETVWVGAGRTWPAGLPVPDASVMTVVEVLDLAQSA